MHFYTVPSVCFQPDDQSMSLHDVCSSDANNNNSKGNAHAYELESELNGLRTPPSLYW